MWVCMADISLRAKPRPDLLSHEERLTEPDLSSRTFALFCQVHALETAGRSKVGGAYIGAVIATGTDKLAAIDGLNQAFESLRLRQLIAPKRLGSPRGGASRPAIPAGPEASPGAC